MKTFKSIIMVRKPHNVIFDCMRDHLSEFAHRLADIDTVTERGRKLEEDGCTAVLNEWKLRYQAPDAIKKLLGSSELGWMDHGRWQNFVCNWSIEPFFLKGQINCKGRTTFEPAMGGQGARITLEGEFEIRQGAFLGTASVIEKPLLGFVESIVTGVLPNNLRSVVEAASLFADGSAQ
jgi:hypothetical protein